MPISTEVLHVYSTGLSDSLPRDMPAEQSAATFHLRDVNGPSLSTCMPTKAAQPASEAEVQVLPAKPTQRAKLCVGLTSILCASHAI